MISGISGMSSYYSMYRFSGFSRMNSANRAAQGMQGAAAVAGGRRSDNLETPVQPVDRVSGSAPVLPRSPEPRLFIRQGADPVEMAVRMRIQYVDMPGQSGSGGEAAGRREHRERRASRRRRRKANARPASNANIRTAPMIRAFPLRQRPESRRSRRRPLSAAMRGSMWSVSRQRQSARIAA